MAKTPMKCPFNGKLCIECNLYRGRHYYLCNCKNYRGYIPHKEQAAPAPASEAAAFEKLKRMTEPKSTRFDAEDWNIHGSKMMLKVIDMETGNHSICEPETARKWNWDDPTFMRFVNGVHVHSWEKLEEILRYHVEKGSAELVIYEGPRFMMLAGG
jgi:hypothetical protein